MRRIIVAASVAIAFASSSFGPAHAGPEQDALSRCLTRSSSEADRTALMTYVFAALSVHPDLRRYSTITVADRVRINKEGAALMQRLLTVDCRRETVAALKSDGVEVIERAFEGLADAASTQMVDEPSVAAAFEGLVDYIDLEALASVMEEAGLGDPRKADRKT